MRRLVEQTVVAALCLLAVEIGAAAFCWWETGRLVYLSSPAKVARPAPLKKPDETGYRQRFHPYFGFTGPYSAHLQGTITNSLGFLQREQITLPYPKGPNDLVVVIFGGSVAANLVVAPQGGLPLRDAIAGEFGDKAGKRIVLVNMAQGAGKQPQQLLELAYLLAIGQQIDVVLNVDGFNEFALAYGNVVSGLDPVLPAGQLMGPLAEAMSAAGGFGDYQKSTYQLLEAREAVARYEEKQRKARTGIAYLYATILVRYHGDQAAKLAEHLSAPNVRTSDWNQRLHAVGLDMPAVPAPGSSERMFDLWLRTSDQMRIVARAAGAKYVHVVQPNQYFSGHFFSADELATALNLPSDHPYRIGTKAGYQLVEDRSALLQERGIESAIHLFDKDDEPVYVDNCCHFTRAGETIFSKLIAASVSRAFRKTTN